MQVIFAGQQHVHKRPRKAARGHHRRSGCSLGAASFGVTSAAFVPGTERTIVHRDACFPRFAGIECERHEVASREESRPRDTSASLWRLSPHRNGRLVKSNRSLPGSRRLRARSLRASRGSVRRGLGSPATPAMRRSLRRYPTEATCVRPQRRRTPYARTRLPWPACW